MKKTVMEKGKVMICVPVTGNTEAKVLEEVKRINDSCDVDMLEWRIDCFEEVGNMEKVLEVLKKIKEINHKPLLFTYRTNAEGGQGTLQGTSEYLMLLKTVILSKLVNIVDVELLLGDTVIKSVETHAHISGVEVLISNHDFDSTPRYDIIVNRLRKLEEAGADIAKVAYMPKNEEDVQALMDASREVADMSIPKVVISMGELGKKTRLQAKEMGSCMTFAMMDEASAPGQITVEEAKTM